jgi:hypothetical protein
MCDYSMMHAKSRPAVVGDKLVVHSFGHTRGFIAENSDRTAVCLLPGTELAFGEEAIQAIGDTPRVVNVLNKLFSRKVKGTAIFRQVNKDQPCMHHDALEMPGGKTVMVTTLVEGQKAVVLQLPAKPRNKAEKKEQERLAVTA